MSTDIRLSQNILVPPPEPIKCNQPLEVSPSKGVELCECVWAIGNPEVQKACYLSRVCTSLPPKCCRFKSIPPILQEGPTCGLTALSMIFNGIPSPVIFLEHAKKMNFTYNGEMFSAENLFEILRGFIQGRNAPIECQLHKGRLNCAKVKDSLIDGSCILVPYDPDFNHGPCLKMGHKAHWALLIGYLIDNNDEFFVFSRHGKTRNIAIWPLKGLSSSNSNLVEFAQPKGYPDMDFLLPEGGIGGEHGLKNRAIIINGVQAETITII